MGRYFVAILLPSVGDRLSQLDAHRESDTDPDNESRLYRHDDNVTFPKAVPAAVDAARPRTCQ
jgi:hypothetical protein